MNLGLSDEEYKALQQRVTRFTRLLRVYLAQKRIRASLFVGGSFAKRTLLQKESYDVDIFLRFPRYTAVEATQLEKALLQFNPTFIAVQGSRRYFQLTEGNVTFEVVPVKKINSPKQMENVTDLSYFHVHYLHKHLTPRMAREVVLLKAFCRASGVYGAESYILGFSGYAVECLILQYKTFKATLRALVKAESKLVIDPARQYKNTGDILRSMNEAKLAGPLVIVDPTWKERNVASAVSNESFMKLQSVAQRYLAKPHDSFFVVKAFDIQLFKKKYASTHLITLMIITDKQAGDIAGTKLKKFCLWLREQLLVRFSIKASHFQYDDGQEAYYYLALKEKKSEQRGPVVSMKQHARAFKQAHPKAYIKRGRLYAPLPVLAPAQFIRNKVTQHQQKQMDIVSLDVS